MASRTAVPDQPRVGGVKLQKNGQANRRVLRDIGNVVVDPAVIEGKRQNKASQPVTRSSGAQLLANKQDGVEKKNCCRKPLEEKVNNVFAGRQAAAAAKVTKKEHLKPKNESVTLISSGESTKRNSGKTLTAILTARSKAACGLPKKPKDLIVDIDAEDTENELAAVEYIEDMYNFYKLTEGDGRIREYMVTQPEINSKMRAVLVDWLIQVHNKFELNPETLYLTVNIVDRFLSVKKVPRKELQLLGISSMLIACKYEEIWAPEVSDFIAISDNAYSRADILVMEKTILGELEWYLTVPTTYVFLVRYVKASIPADKEMENMAFFFAELGLMRYSTIIKYNPSMLAAACVYAARCTLKRSPIWSKTLKHYTGINGVQLIECAKNLISFHSSLPESKLKAVYRKYSNVDKAAVALFPASKELLQNS